MSIPNKTKSHKDEKNESSHRDRKPTGDETPVSAHALNWFGLG